MAQSVAGALPVTASSAHASAQQPGRALVVRGASRGFTVLLLGGMVQPLVALAVPPLGYVWLALVAVVAFAWSARIATAAPGSTLVDAVSAAMGAYLLVAPVVVMLTGQLLPQQILGTSFTALVVAAATYFLRRAGGAR